MYRPDASIDYVIALVIFCFLLPCIAFVLIKMGRDQKDKRFTRAGFVAIGAFLISAVIFGTLQTVGFPKPDEASQHQDMAKSIQKKYNNKYYPEYLRKVEFAEKAGEGETGDFFTLTYNDYKTEMRRFYFDVSGQPSCDCTLYQPTR